ncbi:MAG: PKD domain-containing protein, partial [Euryarchaeota archaeon]|nr:PKD domain-containing protein [Euryarchaeota archaeon]
QWDFDDGNESDVLDAPYVSHNYSVNGTYDVELTVTDVDGATGTDTCRIMINPPEPLTADAGPDQWVGVGAQVQFDGSNSTGCIKEWRWDFGDGTNATVNTSTTTHTYTNTTEQNYTVNLTVVEDHSNKTANDTAIIHVVANGFLIVHPHEGDWVHGNELIEAHLIGMEGGDHTDFSIRSVSSEADYSTNATDDSGETFTANTTSYTYYWNTASLTCGNYTINATAYNSGGTEMGTEMGTDQITVCVCNIPGMVGFWRFDDIVAGGTANDSSCNKNHGNITGNPTRVIDGTVYAYQFNGSGGDYVEVANSTSLSMTNETTVDAWVNSSDAGEQYILAKGDMVFVSGGETIEGGNKTVGQDMSNVEWPAFGLGYKRAQTFKLAADSTLSTARVNIKKASPFITGDVTVAIYTDGGAQPGTEIATYTIPRDRWCGFFNVNPCC